MNIAALVWRSCNNMGWACYQCSSVITSRKHDKDAIFTAVFSPIQHRMSMLSLQ